METQMIEKLILKLKARDVLGDEEVAIMRSLMGEPRGLCQTKCTDR